MKTSKFSPHKTYFVHIRYLGGPIAYVFYEPEDFDDISADNCYAQTMIAIGHNTYHVRYNPIDVGLDTAWWLMKDYEQNFSKPH